MIINSLESFRQNLRILGFQSFWDECIKAFTAHYRPDLSKNHGLLNVDFKNPIFDIENLSELYEIALETDNQISKKELGQYYTPKDTCKYMAKKTVELFSMETDVIADVCCGTGNLIYEVLSILGENRATEMLNNKKLYLYDIDKYAMDIAITRICIKFVKKGDVETFRNIRNLINIVSDDFLTDSVSLPKNCVIISNPPYGKLSQNINFSKYATASTGDMYPVFMEKMSRQCKSAVIVSPQSFIGGNKFKALRSVLSERGGSIFSFDNIPCPIFLGRKKGIFNTNTSNSVRAAITIIDDASRGFRVSPMIRFKTEEREIMFEQLDSLLGNFIYSGPDIWAKIPKSLEPLVRELKAARETVSDLIENDSRLQKNKYRITIPSTPRYFMTGSRRNLSRSSKIQIYAKDKDSFNRLYIMINSTFSYLWWRIYDGGITLSRQTLLTMPVPDIPSSKTEVLVLEGVAMEDEYIVNKKNAGKNNENIKFPELYRKKINHLILSSIDVQGADDALYSVHSNNLLSVLPFWGASYSNF